jgi:uncharacterized protein DUF4440
VTSTSVEIASLVHPLVEAWNRRDAPSFAGLFTPSAEYVTGASVRVRGREAIGELVRGAEAGVNVTVLGAPSSDGGSDAGTLTFRWSAAGPGGPERQGRITCAVVRSGDRWLIDRLENREDPARPGLGIRIEQGTSRR